MEKYESWGRCPRALGQTVKRAWWPEDIIRAGREPGVFLPRGAGRSQGDVCLNNGGRLLDMRGLNRFIAWDKERGILKVEAGATLAEVLKLVVPQGWFLPVTPGTKHITVGGAVANDVHGKNHHRAGTFGCHVRQFGLLRSSGEELICSPETNREWYQATIGGLGLTGVIMWAEIKLIPVVSQLVEEEVIKMNGLDDFFQLAQEADQKFDYTVAWLDCQAKGRQLGRGLFMRGNHAKQTGDLTEWRSWYQARIKWPITGPAGVVNTWTVRAFNELFYRKILGDKIERRVHFNQFFYPLDVVEQWNLIYGRAGFLQYQVVIPREGCEVAIRHILTTVAASGRASFLSTMKYFGDIKSPGKLSFPRPGLALAIDFIDAGRRTGQLLDSLDKVIVESGGAVNPSKDARMSAPVFKASFKNWQELVEYQDPKISSSFWRRVTE